MQSENPFADDYQPKRCGSYPFMNLAEDYGLKYGDVLRLADATAAFYAGDFEAHARAKDAYIRAKEALEPYRLNLLSHDLTRLNRRRDYINPRSGR